MRTARFGRIEREARRAKWPLSCAFGPAKLFVIVIRPRRASFAELTLVEKHTAGRRRLERRLAATFE